MIAVGILQKMFVAHDEDKRILWMFLKQVAMKMISELERVLISTFGANYVYE